ncbi:hypothetical protein OPV22_027473 [Ensete ventricosum]|uniref:Uncharacterized protein n=1 Tax=Ensete ventricosum TaxID=4639 RepID=A0AAV8PXQ1_ENSVE|nr:hypothetical protein OPV22_027473 [Ensete ventricosum]
MVRPMRPDQQTSLEDIIRFGVTLEGLSSVDQHFLYRSYILRIKLCSAEFLSLTATFTDTVYRSCMLKAKIKDGEQVMEREKGIRGGRVTTAEQHACPLSPLERDMKHAEGWGWRSAGSAERATPLAFTWQYDMPKSTHCVDASSGSSTYRRYFEFNQQSCHVSRMLRDSLVPHPP